MLTGGVSVIMMVGNKLDLASNREVSYEEAQRFSDENGLVYIEASAKTGENVEEAFLRTARQIYENIKNGSLDLNSAETGVTYGKRVPGSSLPRGGGDRCVCVYVCVCAFLCCLCVLSDCVLCMCFVCVCVLC